MMNDICTWDEVFTRKKKDPNLTFLLLYWYLFNVPDYQSHIAKKMNDLKKLEEFNIIPNTITEKSNITKYIGEMERYNLVGIKKKEGKRKYYQALSFFYLDPFCITTPNSRGKTIEKHYKEYRSRIIKFGINRFSDELKFNINRNNAVIPAQEIIKDLSSDLNKLMKFITHRKSDYLTLYDLIVLTFRDLNIFFHNYEYSHFEILNKKKGEEMYMNCDEVSITEKYYLSDIDKEELSKLDQEEWETQMFRYSHTFSLLPIKVIKYMKNEIIPTYEKLKFGHISFNKETLRFR